MDIAVAPAHGAFDAAEVGAGGVKDVLAEGHASGLVADQRGEDIVPLPQADGESGAERFLTAPEIDAAGDFPGVVEGRYFVLQGAC